jgi:chromosome segregation ATPase
MRKKTSESTTTFNKRETHLRTIEESLDDVEDEKRSLEAKLATAKQLLKAQEENMRTREDERRQLKSNLVTSELETRGKEAQIRHLNVIKNIEIIKNNICFRKS